MASTSSPIGHNLTSNSNHIKATKTPHLTLLSHKWQWYVFTMEKLAWVYAKDKKALQASLDGLKQDFQLSTTSE